MFHPVEHFIGNINSEMSTREIRKRERTCFSDVRKCRGCIVHWSIGDLNFVIVINRNGFVGDFFDQIFTYDDKYETTGTEILLSTSEYDGKLGREKKEGWTIVLEYDSVYFCYVERSSKKIWWHITNNGRIFGNDWRKISKLDAVNGFIGAIIEIRGILR